MAVTLPPPVLELIISVLESIPLFEGLPRAELEEIAKLVRGRSVKAGEVLFKEGDAGDKFYIVQSGCIELLVNEKEGAEPERAGLKKAGQGFGEMALVTDAPRAVTARAAEPTNLQVIAHEQFERLIGDDVLATHLVGWLAKTLATIKPATAPKSKTDAPASWKEFTRKLQRSLMPGKVPKVAGFDATASIAQDAEGNAQAIWCVLPFAGGGTLFAVLDARGDSLPAGYLLGVARAALYAASSHETNFRGLLTVVNEAVYAGVHGAELARIQAGLMLLDETSATFSIAGDNPAMIVKYDAETQGIAVHGPALGAAADTQYGATRAEMSRSDCAVMFSQSDRGLLLGAADLINGRHHEPIAATAASLHKALMKAQHYRRGDDISFVIARKT